MSATIARRFLALHRKGDPLRLANAWSVGTAQLLESLGFEAVATTSAGHAGTLGRVDGQVSADEALAHAAELARAIELPVNGDLEDGFGPTPADVERTVARAIEAGLAGCSIEDFTRDRGDPIYPRDAAVQRIRAAVRAAGDRIVLTARCENFLHGRPDLGDTIERLKAFEAEGAQVLYAPGLVDLVQIEALVAALEAPVNVLALPGGPTVEELASVGVARVSVGSRFYNEAMAWLRDRAGRWCADGVS
ncbi:MAG: isocitrate lyase/phosphoenolpyruvate mutase family protein [Myxococcales bacterium]|nr:isocitrate lyase/phosphoenolpyruvate mutase family protein [Myxococcales bacterium]